MKANPSMPVGKSRTTGKWKGKGKKLSIIAAFWSGMGMGLNKLLSDNSMNSVDWRPTIV